MGEEVADHGKASGCRRGDADTDRHGQPRRRSNHRSRAVDRRGPLCGHRQPPASAARIATDVSGNVAVVSGQRRLPCGPGKLLSIGRRPPRTAPKLARPGVRFVSCPLPNAGGGGGGSTLRRRTCGRTNQAENKGGQAAGRPTCFGWKIGVSRATFRRTRIRARGRIKLYTSASSLLPAAFASSPQKPKGLGACSLAQATRSIVPVRFRGIRFVPPSQWGSDTVARHLRRHASTKLQN